MGERQKHLLETYGKSTAFNKTIEKSFDSSKLVKQQVEVKKRDGSTYMATRWVSNDTQEAYHFGGRFTKESALPGKNITEKINNVVHDPKNQYTKRSDQHRALMSLGIYDSESHGALLGDALYPSHIKKKELTGTDFTFSDKEKESGAAEGAANVPKTAEGNVDVGSEKFDINDIRKDLKNKDFQKVKEEQKEFLKKKFDINYKTKWDTYKLSLDTIMITGRPKSLIAYGTGGVGKTWDLEQALAANNVRVFDDELHLEPSEYDAVVISGSTSPSDMYNILYTNRDKLVIFDDCDSMWGDQDAENILKKALDTSGDNSIRYGNPKALYVDEESGTKIYPPKQFKFTGQIIFISNMKREDLPQPIVDSRARTIDLSMNMSETLEKLDDIKDKMKFYDKNNELIPVTKEQKNAVLQFLKDYKQYIDIGKVNGRTMGNLALLAHSISNKNDGKWNDKLQTEFEKRSAILLDIA